jgi:uncharacterized membrane protein
MGQRSAADVALGGIAPWRRSFSRAITSGIDRLVDWLAEHWLDLISIVLGVILAGALLTPILAYFDVEPLAQTIFRSYHAICDQIPSHSYFIFGHQIALCQRNLALYGSLWLSSVIFHFVRHRVPPLDWRVLVIMLLPMAIDGVTQLFGWRQSTWELRTITGALFGSGVAWFALPFIQRSVDDAYPALKGAAKPRP